MAAKTKHAKRRRAVEKASTIVEHPSPIDDMRGPMGVRLVPLAAGVKATLRAPGAALLVPTDGIVALRDRTLDRASIEVLPAGDRALVTATSPVAHVLLLAPSAGLVAHVVRTYGGEIDARLLSRYLGTPQVLPRTNWFNEVAHRYLFERAVCKKRDNEATRFLETEIVKEIYFLSRSRDEARDRASVVESGTELVKRAQATIDEHLFDTDVVARLARTCGASESTLLRAFKRELAQTPAAYVRARRLDESMLLLKSRRYAVGEIALMVGYRTFAAFSHAFRERFGVRPSDVRPT
jgi:AraC-like DNA-binding protein